MMLPQLYRFGSGRRQVPVHAGALSPKQGAHLGAIPRTRCGGGLPFPFARFARTHLQDWHRRATDRDPPSFETVDRTPTDLASATLWLRSRRAVADAKPVLLGPPVGSDQT